MMKHYNSKLKTIKNIIKSENIVKNIIHISYESYLKYFFSIVSNNKYYIRKFEKNYRKAIVVKVKSMLEN